MAKLYLVLAVMVAACGPTKGGGGDDDDGSGSSHGPHTLVSITVSPSDAIVELDLNTPATQDYTVTGNYADDTSEDLTGQVTWSVANPAVGSFTAAQLVIPGLTSSQAITSKLTATYTSLTGLAQITVVAHRPQDFFFILPYTDPGGPATKPLNFATAIPQLDVFFLMDVTGSMSGEIANLQASLNSTVLPGIQAAVANSQFGVGAFADFPLSPWGGGGDQPFSLRQTITSTTASIMSGVNSLSGPGYGGGADGPEAGLEAIYQVATGEGLTGPAPTSVAANHTGVGGVAFRADAMPVIVDITDAPAHGVGETGNCGGDMGYTGPVATTAHSRAQTKTALAGICGRVVGISSGSDTCTGVEYMTDLATTTGARVPPAAWDVGTRPAGCGAAQCCTGLNGVGQATDAQGLCPLVFTASGSGTGVGAGVTTGIQMLTRFATFDVTDQTSGVTTDIDGNPLPAGHTTADFLKMITPASFVLPPPPPALPNPTFDATTFYGVTPGTQVGFDVNAFNDFVEQTDQAQIFHAKITVLAGGCTPLDDRDVLILVPPVSVGIGKTHVASLPMTAAM